jgi:hypothetical protein
VPSVFYPYMSIELDMVEHIGRCDRSNRHIDNIQFFIIKEEQRGPTGLTLDEYQSQIQRTKDTLTNSLVARFEAL